MTDEWSAFFQAVVGASSALLGLLFVSLSLNLQAILSQPILPKRALLSLLQLFSVLIVAILVLVPGQPLWLLAPGVAGVGLVSGAMGIHLGVETIRKFPTLRVSPWVNMGMSALSALLFLVAAWCIAQGDFSAFYWIVGGIVISLVKAASDAWVLLVEINR